MNSPVALDDPALVAQSLAGSREAFGKLVARYQSLVCSIAYSATGSVSRSEDLAQETFLAAWRNLKELREPALLRSWLCGIARNLIHQGRRRERREPVAAPLEHAEHEPAPGPHPQEQFISREEEAILWRSLERIPAQYREPLVLFYREHQSVARVAGELELSEEVVRQRLTRGRRLLQDQVLLFVEGALGRTSPGKAFTVGVIAALPVVGGSASAATLGIATAKVAAPGAGAALLGLFIGPLTGLVASAFAVRAGLDAARSEAERRLLRRQTLAMAAGSGLFTLALWALALSRRFWNDHAAAFIALSLGGSVAWGIGLAVAIARATRAARRVRAEQSPGGQAAPDPFEYRSRAAVFGIPLIHIRQAPPSQGARPAIAFFAVADRAVGLIAIGEMAVGLIAIGGVSAGVVAIGGASVGLVALGGCALGVASFGGAALGFVAAGGLALGWHAAIGEMAAAWDLAAGALAFGAHANDATALDFFARAHAGAIVAALLTAVVLLAVGPSAWLARRARRRVGQPFPKE